MRTRFLALTTSLCLLGPPAAAFAQVNYELLPGGYSLGKNGLTTFQQWNALVLSNKDGNAYACLARLPGGGTMSFTCNRLTFSGAFLRGPNVVSMHSAATPPANTLNQTLHFGNWINNRESCRFVI